MGVIKSTVSKVVWVGRATVFLVGLAVILALTLGMASAAVAADGRPFLLGKENLASALSTLVRQGPGPALSLVVQPGQPPMQVNSSEKVTDLNADKVDGKDSTEFLGADQKATDADKLDGYDSGSLPGAIADVAALEGGYAQALLGADYVFLGKTAAVTTVANQRLVGAATAYVYQSSSGAAMFYHGLCYQSAAGGAITNFTSFHDIAELVYSVPKTVGAFASTVPGAGSWKVGFCVREAATTRATYVNSEQSSGWVQVFNPVPTPAAVLDTRSVGP